MPKIIFVCLGNICRSPLAEAIFIKKLHKQASEAEGIEVISAATSDWNIGDGADERSIQVALQYEYTSILNHRAKKLSRNLICPLGNTMIICMDHSNKQNVLEMLENASELSEQVSVHLFSDFGGEIGTEIPDPYYGEMADFENVLVQCERYSEDLLNYIIRNDK